MEHVDVVDENSKVLYKTSKLNAHKKGLLHKTVIAEIIDSKGEMALVIPRSHKQDRGQYVSPIGGHVRAGESDIEGLKREAMEEVGFKNFKYKYIGRGIFNRFVLDRQENHYFILYEIYSDDLPKLGDETKAYKYFTKGEIKKLLKEKPEMFGGAFHFVVKNFYQELIK